MSLRSEARGSQMKSLLSVVLFVVALHGMAAAQDCTIAAYADPEGRFSYADPEYGQSFSVYVVMHVENTAAAAAYQMDYSSGRNVMFLQARFTGPSGTGLSIDEPTGTNAALAACVIGFGGNPVLIDEYLFVVFPGADWIPVRIGPNSSQDPDYPQYVTCNDMTFDCEPGPDMCILCYCLTEERGFSAVKSLFGRD